MANNLFIGFNVVRATQAASFATAGLTSSNCSVVIEVNTTTFKSWIPTRGLNPITGFTNGKGYYIIMLADADLSAYVLPPLPSSGSAVWGGIGGNIEDQEDLENALNAMALAASEIGTEKAAKVGAEDIEITNGAKGIILKTAEGTRGRITLIQDTDGDLRLQITAL